MSRTTFDRRVLPLLETADMPWGTRYIPVDELERFVAERRRPAPGRTPMAPPERPTVVPDELVVHIHEEHAKGKSLRQIARDLNASQTPTAHGGRAVVAVDGAGRSRPFESVCDRKGRPPFESATFRFITR